jgi:NADH-quinone oxidoreductase subunit L
MVASSQSTAEIVQHGIPATHGAVDPMEYVLMAASVGIALLGLGIAYGLYVKKPKALERLVGSWPRVHRTVFNKYYVDEIYEFLFIGSLKGLGKGLWKGADTLIIDGAVHGVAYVAGVLSALTRRIQNGLVQSYALSMVVGGFVVVGYYVIRAVFF